EKQWHRPTVLAVVQGDSSRRPATGWLRAGSNGGIMSHGRSSHRLHRECGDARVFFPRPANLSADMNALTRSACERLGGRGGGKPEFAQGGGPKVSELYGVLEEARITIRSI